MPIPKAYQNDSNAPWNDEPAPECVECDETIVEVEDHGEWCAFKGAPEEVHEELEAQAQPSYDPVEDSA